MLRPLTLLLTLSLIALIALRLACVGAPHPGPASPSEADPSAHALTPPPPSSLPTPADLDPTNPRVVLVRVVDATTSLPLAGARASVRTGWRNTELTSALTDAAGETRFRDLPRSPDLSLVVSRPGALRRERPLRADEERVVIALAPGVPVEGFVRDGADGSRVAGARVTARTAWEYTSLTDDITTGADGHFTIDGVPAGEPFLIDVAADGFRPLEVEERRHGGEPELVLTLDRGAVVSGSVRDERGVAVSGARVYLRSLRGGRGAGSGVSARSDGAGAFRFEGVDPAHAGFLVASKVGVGVARGPEFDLGATPGAGHRSELVLRPALTRLAVRVVDEAGDDVVDVALLLRHASGEPPVSPLTGDVLWELAPVEIGGARVVEPIEAGDYVLTVRTAARFAEVREVVVREGETTELLVRLRDGKLLEGRVRREDGAPLGGQPVGFRIPAGAAPPDVSPPFLGSDESVEDEWIWAATETDDEGQFRFHGLPPIPGRLCVQSRHDFAEWSDFELLDVLPGGASIDVTLRPAPLLVGRYYPPRAGTMTITAAGAFGSGVTDVAPDETGRFEFRLSYVGQPVDLMIAPADGAPWFFRDLVLAPGETFDLGMLRFQAGARVASRVVDSRGRSIGDVHVNVSLDDGRWHRDALTGGDGRFVVEHAPPGLAGALRFERHGYRSERITVPDFATFSRAEVVLDVDR